MLPHIFLSEFQLVKYVLKNYAAISFCLLEKLKRCHQNSSKTQMTVEFLWNSSRISIRILVGNLSGKDISWSLSISIRIPLVNRFWSGILLEFWLEYIIRWLKNSSRISIRILVVNAAAADCRILMEFWLEFQLIFNGTKLADYV